MWWAFWTKASNAQVTLFRIKKENPSAQLETMACFTPLPGTPDYQLSIDHGLKPPQTLEGWGDWIFDDYDFKGERSPWFDLQGRTYLGNISWIFIPGFVRKQHNISWYGLVEWPLLLWF